MLRKRRGIDIEEIKELIDLKKREGYKDMGAKSFRDFIERYTDYAPSTIYTYIKLYDHFGEELRELGFAKASLLLRYGRFSKQDMEMAKKLSTTSLKRMLIDDIRK